MNTKRRFVGIDLFKGIAAYAVVFIHSSGGHYGATGFWAAKVGGFFTEFAVPFFLATSFYLMIKKIYFSDTPYSFKSRIKLLLVSYLIWTAIYLIFRYAKYLAAGDLQKINNLFRDPVGIFFFGGAAVQLYFLPLLIAGTFAVVFTTILFDKKRFNIQIIILLIIVTTITFQKVLESGNAFFLGENEVAFNNLVNTTFPGLNNNQVFRIILVNLSWILTCLPYIFVSILLNHPFVSKKLLKFDIKQGIIFFVLAFGINVLAATGNSILPRFVGEISAAYFWLISSLSLSNQITENNLITNLGRSSFGIYLTHHLFIDIVRPIVYKIYPGAITLITLLTCSIISFLLSWLVVFYFSKYAKIRNLLFGV